MTKDELSEKGKELLTTIEGMTDKSQIPDVTKKAEAMSVDGELTEREWGFLHGALNIRFGQLRQAEL